ncbi:DUF423 domain-containing protein [Arcobacter sp. F2176]|uniref:DUF423 domain-containing protein n=1 Tax=unclassified Arcobacter TaxID=2593671 RepID=UPI00100B0FA2|nr:DUF423 domain-containing protein [Arcobacter sp. F2176]RXJ81129.1 DUF423 domain-containing protein [Arcobacter sp. F2176]
MFITKHTKNFLIIASFMMALGIAIGAFGAHGLKATTDEYLMAVYHTGVQYQFYNTLGLFGVALITYFLPNSKQIVISGYLLILGTLIFSCSLYMLVILKLSWLGAITPFGGTIMIISWIIIGFTVLNELKIKE